MLRIYIGFQAIKSIVFLHHHHHRHHISIVSLHHHHISVVFLHHHHSSIVFPPPPPQPPHIYCFLFFAHSFHFFFLHHRDSLKYCQLPSLVHFVAMSRVVNNNRGFLHLSADCPDQRQVPLKTATPQQLHVLVQVLYNILMEHIPIPQKISGYCCHIRMLYLTWPDQMSLAKQRSESSYKRVVVLLKVY